jgi:hypothetical protein
MSRAGTLPSTTALRRIGTTVSRPWPPSCRRHCGAGKRLRAGGKGRELEYPDRVSQRRRPVKIGLAAIVPAKAIDPRGSQGQPVCDR